MAGPRPGANAKRWPTSWEQSPNLRPNCRWVAYTSDDSKHGHEIYVQSFPAGLGRFQVSDNGGVQPRCRRDGTECSYVAADGKLMAVVVKTVPAFPAGIPHTLFDPRIVVSSFGTPFERNADAFYLKTNRRAGGRSSL